jgi:hypothetical protein
LRSVRACMCSCACVRARVHVCARVLVCACECARTHPTRPYPPASLPPSPSLLGPQQGGINTCCLPPQPPPSPPPQQAQQSLLQPSSHPAPFDLADPAPHTVQAFLLPSSTHSSSQPGRSSSGPPAPGLRSSSQPAARLAPKPAAKRKASLPELS